MRMVETPEALRALIGQELGVSDWLEVTQDLIDRFAEVTGDHQWIHVDVERAKREMPGGKTIAHGYLLLSLLPKLGAGKTQIIEPIQGTVPTPSERSSGCPFHPRCPQVIKGTCDVHFPRQVEVGAGHKVRCHLYT